MNKSNKKNRVVLLLLIPFSLLMSYLASRNHSFTEKIYSMKFYRILSQIISSITGIFPFSVAELLFILFITISASWIIACLLGILKNKEKLRRLSQIIISILIFVGVLYFGFLLVWGLNYSRQPFSKIANMEVKPTSVSELESLCESLILELNALRNGITENDKGIMSISGGYEDVFRRANLGYQEALKVYPKLGGSYGIPKKVMFSRVLSYSGIYGIYFPFTGEANVNTDIPDSMLPSTACHEMAHQRGFAREDEANYISYLVCSFHPDADFKYSGTLLATINSMNALYTYDLQKYKDLTKLYNDGVKRDIQYINSFNKQYSGKVEEISSRINDTYLRANRQKDGVNSYGRMVDLLLAEHRAKLEKQPSIK